MLITSGRIAIVVGACAAACGPAAPPATRIAPVGPAVAEVISCIDLPPGDARSHNLSGLAWDGAARRLFAISDRDRQLTVIAPNESFTAFELLPPIPLDISAEAVTIWDGEAVVLAGDRFFVVANETDPALFSVDRSGHGAVPLVLPAFPQIRDNLGLESLGYLEAAGARYVFAANEEALEGDGPISTIEHGTVVRLLRHPLDGGADVEVAYLTEPIFASGGKSDNGVSDLVPLSPDRVLLVERAWVKGTGNAVRLFEADLHDAPSVLGVADARTVAPVHKRLVVDLATLPDDRCPPVPAAQPRKTLQNYEGIALGPVLADGRQVVFLITDDNNNRDQVARLLTLALVPGAL